MNKIGHALHALDPDFRALTLDNESVRQITHDLGRHRQVGPLASPLRARLDALMPGSRCCRNPC